MAVLVQRLVPANAAGVAFTANPVTGNRAETVVSAVKGLGDRLVSGQVSPDEWLVKGEDTICQRSQEDTIDAAQARAVAELARRVEAHFGAPQDIEWAFVGGQLFLLQARPITAREYRVPAVVATGNATRVLHDGQNVTVDGSLGMVEHQGRGRARVAILSFSGGAGVPQPVVLVARSGHRAVTPARAGGICRY